MLHLPCSRCCSWEVRGWISTQCGCGCMSIRPALTCPCLATNRLHEENPNRRVAKRKCIQPLHLHPVARRDLKPTEDSNKPHLSQDSTTGTGLTENAQNPNKILKHWLSRYKAWNIPKQWPLRTERGEKEPCHCTMAGHPGKGVSLWVGRKAQGPNRPTLQEFKAHRLQRDCWDPNSTPLKESKPVCKESFENQRRLHGGTQCVHVTRNTHSC